MLVGLLYVAVAMVRRCFALLPGHLVWGGATAVGALILATAIVGISLRLWSAWQEGAPTSM